MIERFSVPKRTALKRHSPKPRPAADPKYLAWIRTLACLICLPGLQASLTESAHTGVRGLLQRAPDRQAIPLCGTAHHRLGPESHHVLGRQFFIHHGLDRELIVAGLNARYDAVTRIPPRAARGANKAKDRGAA